MTVDERNLTGVWNGLYSYSDGESVSFVATLIHSGSSVSGATEETGGRYLGRRTTLRAHLHGSCAGDRVGFVKTYDGSGGYRHSIRYDGTLNSEATEIEGVWTIPGSITGRFLMIRAGLARREKAEKMRESV